MSNCVRTSAVVGSSVPSHVSLHTYKYLCMLSLKWLLCPFSLLFRGYPYFWNVTSNEVTWYPPPGCEWAAKNHIHDMSVHIWLFCLVRSKLSSCLPQHCTSSHYAISDIWDPTLLNLFDSCCPISHNSSLFSVTMFIRTYVRKPQLRCCVHNGCDTQLKCSYSLGYLSPLQHTLLMWPAGPSPLVHRWCNPSTLCCNSMVQRFRSF